MAQNMLTSYFNCPLIGKFVAEKSMKVCPCFNQLHFERKSLFGIIASGLRMAQMNEVYRCNNNIVFQSYTDLLLELLQRIACH